MNKRNFLFTSESVTEGHPDKICDQISDAVLDDVIKQDPRGRVACETFITVGLVLVGGEITTKGWVDLQKLVRNLLTDIGYTNARYGFDAKTCAILNAIGRQSQDIAQGVDTGGAGDQGVMIGYACRETPELMPLPIMLAHKLTRRLAEVRKKGIIKYLGPDGKSQVTVEYENGKPVVVARAVIAAQHAEEVVDKTGKRMTEEAKEEITKKVIIPALGEFYDPKKTKCFINETGKFVTGGPQSDTGMTGRKIIVDTYGGMAPHGGGAFSGKDPTKVDRSASYMARYIAKNIVASELADKCMVHLAYVIGVAEPVCINVDTFGTGKVPEKKLEELMRKHFELTPQGMIKMLNLLRPIYRKTAAYGHFGREEEEFTWEKTDKAKDLGKEV
ncbi:methionine adenosyltransferase [bacterium]|nr:methionine adenosyltransferase [bacterium]